MICHRCGECCSYTNYIIVGDEDIRLLRPLIEEHNLTVLPGEPLNLLKVGDSCLFLDRSAPEARCTIHEVRPSSCRGFFCRRGEVGKNL